MHVHWPNLSLLWRFVCLYAFLAVCLILVFVASVYFFLSVITFTEMRDEARELATRVAEGVDVPLHEQLQSSYQEGSDPYLQVQENLLQAVLYNPRVDSVYTLRRTDDPNTFAFVVDSYTGEDLDGNGRIDADEEQAHLGELYDVSEFPEMRAGFDGPTADHEVTVDKWGEWISGYAPLYNEEGEAVAIVGVDLSAALYWDAVRSVKFILIILIAFAIVLSFLSGVLGSAIFQRANEKLKHYAGDLEREVKAKTAELAKKVEVIEDQNVELARLSEAKSQFVSLASHQLRTPLTGINWQMEALLTADLGTLAKPQQSVVGEVLAQSKRMLKLVNELLNINRIESGRLRIHPIPTSLSVLIQTVLKDAQSLARLKKTKLVFTPPRPKPPKVSVDPDLIYEVMHNVITNAIRYSPPASTVTIALVCTKEACLIKVKDEGIGIPKEDWLHIFELGFRAENARRLDTEGSGLGLYLAKMIVDTTGGKIWFETKPGSGTTFFVSIPSRGMKARAGEKSIVRSAH